MQDCNDGLFSNGVISFARDDRILYYYFIHRKRHKRLCLFLCMTTILLLSQNQPVGDAF